MQSPEVERLLRGVIMLPVFTARNKPRFDPWPSGVEARKAEAHVTSDRDGDGHAAVREGRSR
jgi:hypothetical protein